MWQLRTPQGAATFSASTLLQQLVGKLRTVGEKPDQEMLIRQLVEQIPSDAYAHSTIGQLIGSAFRLGYMYRLFLEKNDVVCPREPTNSDINTKTGDAVIPEPSGISTSTDDELPN